MRFEVRKLIDRAEAANNARNFIKAEQLFSKALAHDPDDLELGIKYALSLFALEDFAKSAENFHQLHLKYPDDARIWHGCSSSYLKLGQFTMASMFLKKIVSKNPDDLSSWMNLCFAAGSEGKHSDCLFYAMQAMQLAPLEPRVHNNLGSALLLVRRYEDALTSFGTALELDKDNLDALSNIATTYSLIGRPAEALDIYEECLQRTPDGTEFHQNLKYRMSFDLFRMGRLELGWQYYEHGFRSMDSRTRSPKRRFAVPKWDGRELADETLLIWREQGLGDELVFFGALRDVQTRVRNIIVECDPRLVPVLQRSFPTIKVRPQLFFGPPSMESPHSDFDWHLPAGSLMQHFRNSIDDFRKTESYVVPNPELREQFKQRLAGLPNRVKIGICWRSGVLSTERNTYYTSVSDWEPVLRLKGVDFINLQYGDCRQEVANVAEHFGTTLHQWPDLNLKDDLDGVFSLISCLDHVVTVDTSVSAMAPAVGTPTSVLLPDNTWMRFGIDEYLIFPNITPYLNEQGHSLRERIPDLAESLIRQFNLDQRVS